MGAGVQSPGLLLQTIAVVEARGLAESGQGFENFGYPGTAGGVEA